MSDHPTIRYERIAFSGYYLLSPKTVDAALMEEADNHPLHELVKAPEKIRKNSITDKENYKIKMISRNCWSLILPIPLSLDIIHISYLQSNPA